MEKIMKNQKFIKLFCIICATLLWIYVSYQENPTMTQTVKNVPLTVDGEESLKENGFAVFSISEQTVTVKATSERLSLRKINSSTIKASVNVSSIKKAGKHTIPATAVCSSHPNADLYVKSKDITVIIEPIETKSLDIKANILKSTDSSVLVRSHSLSSEKVKVSGKQSILKEIGQISTEEILPDITASSQTVKVIVYAKDGKVLEGVECNPSEVTVTYNLYDTKTVPIVLKTSDGKIHALSEKHTANVYGYGEVFNNLKQIETQPLNMTEFDVGMKVNIKLNPPKGIYLKSSSEIELKIKEAYYE